MRAFVHYMVTLSFLTLYGAQVCPFVEGMHPGEWIIILSASLGATFAIRGGLVKHFIESVEFDRRVRRQFILDFGLFLMAGGLLITYNTLAHHFPLASALKMGLGFLTPGFFAALDLALERERMISGQLAASGLSIQVSGERLFPLTTRFALTAVALVTLWSGTLFLVVVKDMEWLVEYERGDNLMMPAMVVLAEIALVGAVALAEAINIIFSYSRNLKLFFTHQNGALSAVTRGELESRVPVSTRDEFGVMGEYTNIMITALKERTREVALTQDVTIHSLASLAETRDNETGAHILRTQRYIKALALRLRDMDGHNHPELLDDGYIELLFKSAPLHDIGKVGVPDAILLKPGKLTDDEFTIMKTHASMGREALLRAEGRLGSNSFLRLAREIAGGHHERWDGKGYPDGQTGERIPLSARLMAVADVYDALISKRVYKEAFTHEKSRGIIMEGRGNHFDPAVIEAFQRAETEFSEIARTYADGH
ncbi:MAG: HD domain-containing protein [Nitrospinae bacterium]|nr:HD domain-containing protein [Nitrospinota bacterium]